MESRITSKAVSQHQVTSDQDALVWRPSLLTLWFLVIVAFDIVILIFATGVVSMGSDAAGNGMVDGFRQGFAQLTACALGLVTLIFLVIRHRGIWIAFMVLLVPLTLFSLMLMQ